AVCLDALVAERRERRSEAALGLRVLLRVEVALRADEQEGGRPLGRAAADAIEEALPENSLVGDDEDVGLPRARGDVGHDVLEGPVAREAAELAEDAPASQPAGLP